MNKKVINIQVQQRENNVEFEVGINWYRERCIYFCYFKKEHLVLIIVI